MVKDREKYGINTKCLVVLLIIYAFFSPIEMFLGTRFESLFKIIQYLLVVLLLLNGPILKGKLYIGDAKKHPVFPFLLLLAFSVFSILWSQDTATGTAYIKSIGIRMLMIVLAYQLCIEEKHIRQMFIALMLGTAILSVMVTRSSITSSMLTRTSILYRGSAFDTNNLSGYIAIGLGLMLNFKFERKDLTIIKWVCCGICVLAVLMTSSRGGAVAVIGAILFTCFIQGNFKNTVKYLIIVIIGGLALILMMRAMGVSYVSNLIERFIYDSNGSGADRFVVWGYALQLAERRPLAGYGIGSAFAVLQQYFNSSISTHNVYFTFLLDGGAIGLGLFLTCLFRCLVAKRTEYFNMTKVMIVASMLVSLFLDTYNKKILWLPLFFAALAYTVEDTRERTGENHEDS